MMTRRHTDNDDDGALSRRARPAWNTIALIGAVLVAGGMAAGTSRALAKQEAEIVVSTVERRLDNHLAEMVGKQAIMDSFARRIEASQCATARNTYKLCMAARIECEAVSANCNGGR